MRYAVLGNQGMVGAAIYRALHASLREGDELGNLHWKPDFREQNETRGLIEAAGDIDVLFLCAARVGGIQRNIAEPGAMLYDNLMIQANVIEAARLHGVKLLVFLGSSCIYPHHERVGTFLAEDVSGPWAEGDLLRGPLEPTNESYAIAKIAGIKMLEAYERQYGMKSLILMPCNLYGPGDHYKSDRSHMVPALIRRFHEAKVSGAKSVIVWGTGTPRRELMHVDDLASAALHLVERGCTGMYNVGPGVDRQIGVIAQDIRRAVFADAPHPWPELCFAPAYPDGVASKLLDVSKLRSTGWDGCRPLADGLRDAYRAYLETLR